MLFNIDLYQFYFFIHLQSLFCVDVVLLQD